MAGAFLYGLGRNLILTQGTNVVTGALCGSLVAITGGSAGTTNYVVAQNTDQFFNIIPGFATTGTGSVLSGGFNSSVSFGARTTALGALFVTGNQLVFPSVPSNTLGTGGTDMPVGALVFWINTGTASTSPLIGYIDFTNWTPANTVAPNGSSITLTFPSTNPGLFQL